MLVELTECGKDNPVVPLRDRVDVPRVLFFRKPPTLQLDAGEVEAHYLITSRAYEVKRIVIDQHVVDIPELNIGGVDVEGSSLIDDYERGLNTANEEAVT